MERRDRTRAAIRFALMWPAPVFVLVAAVLVTINEHVLHRHVFAAAVLAGITALLSLLAAGGWAQFASPRPRPALQAAPRRSHGDDPDHW